jgi:hypothetical protein
MIEIHISNFMEALAGEACTSNSRKFGHQSTKRLQDEMLVKLN